MSEHFAILHFNDPSDMIKYFGYDKRGQPHNYGNVIGYESEIVCTSVLPVGDKEGFRVLITYRIPDPDGSIVVDDQRPRTREEWLGLYNCRVYGMTAQREHGDGKDHSACEHLPVYVRREVKDGR
jgi:hypothetical protein